MCVHRVMMRMSCRELARRHTQKYTRKACKEIHSLSACSPAYSRLSGDLNSDINACFIPTNEPKQASQAEIRLDVEMVSVVIISHKS